jgi:hypothetical protein
METQIAIENLNKFENEWDLYDLPDRDACVRNLEALLCLKSRSGEDTTKVLAALSYFRSMDASVVSSDVLLPTPQTSNDGKFHHKLVDATCHKLANATRDALTIIGALVMVSALSGGFANECGLRSQKADGNANVELTQPKVDSRQNY